MTPQELVTDAGLAAIEEAAPECHAEDLRYYCKTLIAEIRRLRAEKEPDHAIQP